MAFDHQKEDNLEATELRLGLPGSEVKSNNKRALPDMNQDSNNSKLSDQETSPSSKAQVVGWPPIRSYRKNNLQAKKSSVEGGLMFVKVSMDGAPYLRKVDLKMYKAYPQLVKALQELFNIDVDKQRDGSEFVATYEDKDGDWMLLGDVPWE
ncbi:hypothetical protein ACFE04_024911 [Oxalis oulophora]